MSLLVLVVGRLCGKCAGELGVLKGLAARKVSGVDVNSWRPPPGVIKASAVQYGGFSNTARMSGVLFFVSISYHQLLRALHQPSRARDITASR